MSYNESTSATGGLGGAGSSGVSAYPSGLGGQSIGLNWASNVGTPSPGDISAPYNPGGSNRVRQSIEMGKNHGPRTGKKSREKKLDLKALRDAFKKEKEIESDSPERVKKVMSFDDFEKEDITDIKR